MDADHSKPSGCARIAGYLFLGLLAVGIVGGIVAYRYSTQTIQAALKTPAPSIDRAEIRRIAMIVPYDTLARNTESYVGRTIKVSGDVVQVIEGMGERADLRVRVTDGDIVLVHYAGARLLVGDTITLYARVDGRITYETVLGARLTVPELTALLVEAK